MTTAVPPPPLADPGSERDLGLPRAGTDRRPADDRFSPYLSKARASIERPADRPGGDRGRSPSERSSSPARDDGPSSPAERRRQPAADPLDRHPGRNQERNAPAEEPESSDTPAAEPPPTDRPAATAEDRAPGPTDTGDGAGEPVAVAVAPQGPAADAFASDDTGDGEPADGTGHDTAGAITPGPISTAAAPASDTTATSDRDQAGGADAAPTDAASTDAASTDAASTDAQLAPPSGLAVSDVHRSEPTGPAAGQPHQPWAATAPPTDAGTADGMTAPGIGPATVPATGAGPDPMPAAGAGVEVAAATGVGPEVAPVAGSGPAGIAAGGGVDGADTTAGRSAPPDPAAVPVGTAPAERANEAPEPPPATALAQPIDGDVDTDELWGQLQRALNRVRPAVDGKELRIRLHPAELGELLVQVRTQGEHLAVRLVTSSPAAHQVLLADQQRLSAELAAAGFDDGTVDISQRDPSGNGARGGGEERSQSRPARNRPEPQLGGSVPASQAAPSFDRNGRLVTGHRRAGLVDLTL